ncbi:MAG: nitroreductase family protein [Promethearchaeota archaeon]|jgi:nitroreductase/NAD-dependent dihydropyrimidine dehydrogenase PreA subunit
MPIMGIDSEKCSNCKQCISECPTRNFKFDEKQEKTLYVKTQCILCGHCIAICPENAILYEDMKDIAIDIEMSNSFPSTDSIYTLIRSKRSVRRYQEKLVPNDIIKKIMETIRYAPTAINLRSIKSILISGKEKIDKFTDTIIESIEPEKEKSGLKNLREKGINPFFYNAPHVLILHSNNGWAEINATIAITYAMLFAETLGIGSCWIGGIQKLFAGNNKISEKAIGNSDKVGGIMIFGYPSVKYRRVPPRPPINIKYM